MANVFRSRHKTNISNTATEDILTTSDTNGKQIVLIGLQLVNTGSSEIKATVVINNNAGSQTGDVTLLNETPVPANTLVSVLVGDKIVLESNDVLKIQSDTASALNAVASYLEIT